MLSSAFSFLEARDQPEPGSFFPRMKDPGNEVATSLAITYTNNVPDKLKPLLHTADFTLNSQLNYSPPLKVHYVF